MKQFTIFAVIFAVVLLCLEAERWNVRRQKEEERESRQDGCALDTY
jgi:hypothetical protein